MRNQPLALALVAALAGLLLLPASPARADKIVVLSGAQKARLELKDVQIKGIKNGEIFFTISGRDSARRLEDVVQIEVSGEAKFNEAEAYYAEAKTAKDEKAAKSKYGDALKAYQSSAGSAKPWLKELAGLRIREVAPKTGQFDVGLNAWLESIKANPAEGAKNKPSVQDVDPKSAYLTGAVKTLEGTLASTPTAQTEQRRLILELLGDVKTRMGDAEGALKVAIERVKLGGNPEEIANLGLKQAQAEFAKKNYDAAMGHLSKVDLNHLAEGDRPDAYHMLAECQGAKLSAGTPPDTIREIALAYARVFAGFPRSPYAGPALLKVAECHELLKENETAMKLYQQIAKEFAGSPTGQTAQQAADRLKAKAG